MTSKLVFEAEIYSKIERGYEKWLLQFKMLKFVNISISRLAPYAYFILKSLWKYGLNSVEEHLLRHPVTISQLRGFIFYFFSWGGNGGGTVQ